MKIPAKIVFEKEIFRKKNFGTENFEKEIFGKEIFGKKKFDDQKEGAHMSVLMDKKLADYMRENNKKDIVVFTTRCNS